MHTFAEEPKTTITSEYCKTTTYHLSVLLLCPELRGFKPQQGRMMELALHDRARCFDGIYNGKEAEVGHGGCP